MSPTRASVADLWAVLGMALLVAACGPSAASMGRRLFEGEQPLVARLAGHDDALPAQASRCINCHEFGASVTMLPASAGEPARAASKIALSSPSLVASRPRRGGPPSHFDEPTFCRLLRTGLDPASVLVPQSMPRYDIDPPHCKALWAYLSASGG